MTDERTLYQRRRDPTAQEEALVPWLSVLNEEQRAIVLPQLKVGEAEPGEYVCRSGRPMTYYFGVVDGLLKASSDDAEGGTMTFSGIPPGGWFGEGTALKCVPYRYSVSALRKTVVAGIPVSAFHWLVEHSNPFSRFLLSQLNERLGQFMAAREIDRMTRPELRVARSLAAMLNPILFPGVGRVLRINQRELGYLVGLSRQRVNAALSLLQAHKAIRVDYGGISILDLEALRHHAFTDEPRR